jgi:hypothetical protein
MVSVVLALTTKAPFANKVVLWIIIGVLIGIYYLAKGGKSK